MGLVESAEAAEAASPEPRGGYAAIGARRPVSHSGGGNFRGVAQPPSRIGGGGGYASPRGSDGGSPRGSGGTSPRISPRAPPRASPFASASPRTVAKTAAALPMAPGVERQLGTANMIVGGAARIEQRPRCLSSMRVHETRQTSPRYTGPCFEEATAEGHPRALGVQVSHDGAHAPGRPIRPPFEAGILPAQGKQWLEPPDFFAADRRPTRQAQRVPTDKARHLQCSMCTGMDDMCPDAENNPEHDLRQRLKPAKAPANDDGFSI